MRVMRVMGVMGVMRVMGGGRRCKGMFLHLQLLISDSQQLFELSCHLYLQQRKRPLLFNLSVI